MRKYFAPLWCEPRVFNVLKVEEAKELELHRVSLLPSLSYKFLKITCKDLRKKMFSQAKTALMFYFWFCMVCQIKVENIWAILRALRPFLSWYISNFQLIPSSYSTMFTCCLLTDRVNFDYLTYFPKSDGSFHKS